MLCLPNGANGRTPIGVGMRKPRQMSGLVSGTTGKQNKVNRHPNHAGQRPGAIGAVSKTSNRKVKRMQHISEILPPLIPPAEASGSDGSSPPAPTKTFVPIFIEEEKKEDPESILTISYHLALCFDVYPLYGREADAAEGIQKAFKMTLAHYSAKLLDEAFRAYYRYGSEFPVPGQILMIIERKNKPPFHDGTFRFIQHIPRDQRKPDDWDYLKGFATFKKWGRC